MQPSLFLSVLVLGLASAGGDGGHATPLDAATFDDYVKKRQESATPCLIMFHVSWCKVCQKTFPHFAKASTLVLEQGLGMDFAHVDCERDKPLCKRYNVKGYPTIKLVEPTTNSDEEPRSYKGQRTEEGFVKYVKRMLEAPVQPVSDAAALVTVGGEEPYAAFVASGDPKAKGLVHAAKKWMDRHRFLSAPGALGDIVQDAPQGATLAALGSSSQQWRGAAKEAAPYAAFYTGDLNDPVAVEEWVAANRFPGVTALGEGNFYEFSHNDRPTVIVALDPDKTTALEEKALRNAQQALGKDYQFGAINGVDFAEELNSFGIPKGALPAVLMTESNFEVWIEDTEALRLHSLISDVKAIRDGAPVLRQSKGSFSKLMFYKRKIVRFAISAKEYASQGPTEMATVAACSALALFSLWALGKILGWVLSAVFSEGDEPDYEQMHQELKRQREAKAAAKANKAE